MFLFFRLCLNAIYGRAEDWQGTEIFLYHPSPRSNTQEVVQYLEVDSGNERNGAVGPAGEGVLGVGILMCFNILSK